MFSQVVGQVDLYSAAVLCALFAVIGIIATTMVGKRRSKRELEMQFTIDKEKLANEDRANKRANDVKREFELAKLSTEKDVQFERIHSGLIESKAN